MELILRHLSHWSEEYSPAESLDILSDYAEGQALQGGSQGTLLAKLIRKKQLREVLQFEIDYAEEGLTAFQVRSLSQAKACFSKLRDLDLGFPREEDCLRKFLEAERLNRETNCLLREVRAGRASLSPAVSSVLYKARRKIADVLGPVPKMQDLHFRFGPGATRGVKRSEASVRRKLAEDLTCSTELLPMVSALLGEMPVLAEFHEKSSFVRTVDFVILREDGSDTITMHEEWARVEVAIRPSKLGFVPKNAKSFRSVNVEPGLNVVFQLGIGDYMAKRMSAFGIDIRDQTLNQRRAMEGSLTGALATLDLSSASDTISKEIVFELLPLDWATLLSYGRSCECELPTGEVILQEKFSSMGNGFTFPLETLIFWGLSASCCESDDEASVYGDDIIVPVTSVPALLEVLRVCGFLVNREKSYYTTPFRESCGKDYFRGIDVRPVFPRQWLGARTLFTLCNFFHRRSASGDADSRAFFRRFLDSGAVLAGPDGFGDGHVIEDHPRLQKPSDLAKGFNGYFFWTLGPVISRDEAGHEVDRLLPAYFSYSSKGEWEDIPWTTIYGSLEYATNVGIRKASLSLPERLGVKLLGFPGADVFKKVKIYTLG